ncbi:hypothetical protein Y958_04695 [Nitrospirillum viridazoti CBAmc]|uniref:Uncharacterized protein n=1 Tax=Nitrospirillum viridazoti CBAmc TaxID=1441467 RepID=A0A248JN76_9PROT|nr:hypothetical protein Y958_04695 [Nitrospirillum amazonense CBAmc]
MLGPRLSRPRWWSCDRGRSARTRRAETQWKAAGDGFFASRCKARSRAAEKSWRRTLQEDDRGEAALRSDPIHSRTPWVRFDRTMEMRGCSPAAFEL